ncbi:hypothetical protein HCN44_004856 [Aphidius gifuensis]|uniref:DNA endonuclease activator Ctp1 C-terminal domain-containing protein n=1 Tax=Aphidius gifuensis TaxID=684658 RepID=A0A834XVT8_APHGI|nr:hypothetical protein HCN44_004856 [Aphidius gifuensis]
MKNKHDMCDNISRDKNILRSLSPSEHINHLSNYDRVPEKKKKCLQYPHKGPVVRKKLERAKLTGWDCDKCEKYYKSLGLSPEKLKKRKNLSSRHRSEYNERYETPPGFWDPTFSQSSIPPDSDTD